MKEIRVRFPNGCNESEILSCIITHLKYPSCCDFKTKEGRKYTLREVFCKDKTRIFAVQPEVWAIIDGWSQLEDLQKPKKWWQFWKH